MTTKTGSNKWLVVALTKPLVMAIIATDSTTVTSRLRDAMVVDTAQ